MLYYFHLAACSLLADAELPGVHLLGQGVRLPPAVLLAGVLAPVHLHLNLLGLGHSLVLAPTTSAHQQARNRSNINQSEINDDENLK